MAQWQQAYMLLVQLLAAAAVVALAAEVSAASDL